MPFLDENGGPLTVIPLRQAPATKPYFQLARPIGFREHAAAPTYWVPAHEASANPASKDRTDLASVPPFLQGFIASYGRQSAPAILHDHQRQVTNQLGTADALTQAEEDDRVFRVALRQQKVPLLRAWLMWAFVSVERYWLYARRWAAVLIAHAVVVAAARSAGRTRPAMGPPVPAGALAELRLRADGAPGGIAIVRPGALPAAGVAGTRDDRPAVHRPRARPHCHAFRARTLTVTRRRACSPSGRPRRGLLLLHREQWGRRRGRRHRPGRGEHGNPPRPAAPWSGAAARR